MYLNFKCNFIVASVLLLVVLFPCFIATGSVQDADVHTELKTQEDLLPKEKFDVFDLDTSSNSTNGTSSTAAGFIGAAIAVFFFGSNLVPIKKADTGDGMFYQWVDCIAIWNVGLIVHLVRNSPPFYPLAMLGGFLWATGNVTVVPIIKTIGLSLGILIWGSLNLLTGWASGHFGLFGINKDHLHNQAFNYVGVALALLRFISAVCIKPSVSTNDKPESKLSDIQKSQPSEKTPLLESVNEKTNNSPDDVETKVEPPEDTSSWVDKLSPIQKRIVGVVLSVAAGCFYGFNFVPCIWIQDNVENASQNGLDYVFSHFCGILLTSSVYFMLYCMYMRNRPHIGVGLVLPSAVSGLMWGVAQAGWFVANFNLSESVSFPIITTGPGIIASLWGVLLFHEIRGTRNLLVLGVAFSITITGAIFSALSK